MSERLQSVAREERGYRLPGGGFLVDVVAAFFRRLGLLACGVFTSSSRLGVTAPSGSALVTTAAGQIDANAGPCGAQELTPRTAAAVEMFDEVLLRLEQVSERMTAATEGFAARLEHASHNLLQAVEGMRAAAAELRAGTSGLESHLNRLEGMYEAIGEIAGEVSRTRTKHNQQMETVADSLHGITASLTTVVACANQAQQAVTRVAGDVASSTGRLEDSVERLVGVMAEIGGSQAPRPSATGVANVTLRQVMDVQRQFINTLDDRLSRLNSPHSSSSKSSPSSSSSSSCSPKLAPSASAPSAQAT